MTSSAIGYSGSQCKDGKEMGALIINAGPLHQTVHSSKILSIQQGLTRGVSSVGKPCRHNRDSLGEFVRAIDRCFRNIIPVLRFDHNHNAVE